MESVALLAVHAVGWLENATHIDGTFLLTEALGTSEVRLFHFRDDVAIANHDTTQRNEFLDVRWTKLAKTVDFSEVVGSDLNDMLAAKLVVIHVVVSLLVILPANIVHVELLIDLGDHQIENGDNVGRVVLNLPVEHLVELEHMIAVYVKDISIKFAYFLQLLDVVGSLLELLVIFIVVIVLDLFKVVDKVFEFHLNIASVDIGAPENLSMGAHLVGALKLALVHHARRRGFVINELNLCTLWIESWLIHKAACVDQEASLLIEVRHQGRRV